jgi:hypothetical protein
MLKQMQQMQTTRVSFGLVSRIGMNFLELFKQYFRKSDNKKKKKCKVIPDR